MKKIKLFVFLSVFALFACDNDDKDSNETTIIGSWKLTSVLWSDGGSTNNNWTNVNGHSITLMEDGSFFTTQFDDCQTGVYTIQNNLLTLNYNCANVTIPNKFNIIFLSPNEMILSNIYCIEECKDKYSKLN